MSFYRQVLYFIRKLSMGIPHRFIYFNLLKIVPNVAIAFDWSSIILLLGFVLMGQIRFNT